MNQNNSCFKRIILSIFILFASVQLAYAENIEANREKAKAAYFSGDLDTSLPLFLSLSESGDAESQYYIGLIYLSENGSGRNVEKAMAYLMTSADQNNAEAMWKIGEVYENGWTGNKDLLTAIDWYRKSKQSEAIKSRIRFLKLKNAHVVLRNNSEVIQELVNKAEKNIPEAEFKLANIYDEGRLTERDLDKSIYWYKKAAMNNHTYSMLMMGYFLCRGIGIEVNKVKAIEWFKKSGRKVLCN